MRAGNGTRRDVLRGVFATVLTAALAPLVTASRPSRTEGTSGGTSGAGPTAGRPGDPVTGFDEMYRGCRIRGFKDTLCGARAAGAARAGSRTASGGSWRITVDDRPLHLMRRADGGYLTMIDHYQSYPTPLAAARAVVDELDGTLRLSTAAAAGMSPGEPEEPREQAAPGKPGERERRHGHGVRA